MKYFLLTVLFLVFGFSHAQAIETSAKQAYIVDYETGQVLYEKNAQDRMPTSSMSKVMTAYMVFDALQKDKIKEDESFLVSEKAWQKGGSKMFVPVGERVNVMDLLRGVIIQSGNDATIVLAEALAGTEDAFAKNMTRKAKDIGMKNTNFMNASGWPDDNHYSTAEDLGIMAKSLIKNFPNYYELYKETEFEFSDIKQSNRNPLLYENIGADGIKTGHTEAGGYGLIGSAVRDNRRVVMVLNGMESADERKEQSLIMMRWALSNFINKTIIQKNQVMGSVPVLYGEMDSVSLVASSDLIRTISKSEDEQPQIKLIHDEIIEAPIQKDQKIGTIEVTISPDQIETIDLLAGTDIPEAGLVDKTIQKTQQFIKGLLE
ncbi:MAG: D-alanyl-D-alanine carboxypeptidase family protein [Pseudomonadota bacterium]